MNQRWLKLLIGVAISLLSLYLALVGVDYHSVGASLAGADRWLVGLALASVLLNNWAKAVRWKILMGERGAHVPLIHALRLHLVGQMLNHLLPSRIGDLSRIYMANDLGLARAFVLGTVAIEKVIDMVWYGLIFGLLLLLMPLPAWVSQPAYLMVTITSLTVLALGVMLLVRRGQASLPDWMLAWLPQRLRARAATLLGNVLDSLQILADSRQNLRLGIWSSLIWITAVLTNHWTLQALGIELPLVAALFVLFILIAGINLPSAPGRIGLFQYLCILGLAVFGVDQAAALSFGVLLHALVYLPPIIAGLSTLWLKGQRLPPTASLSADQPLQRVDTD